MKAVQIPVDVFFRLVDYFIDKTKDNPTKEETELCDILYDKMLRLEAHAKYSIAMKERYKQNGSR